MKFRKALALLLAAVTGFSVFACTNKPDEKDDGAQSGTAAVSPITVNDNHFVDNQLHKVTLTEVGRTFVKDGTSEYSIVVAENEEAVKTALFVAARIYDATGVQLDIVEGGEVDWDESSKYIAIGRNDLFSKAGLTMPSDDLGVSGYYIKSAGESLFIMVNEETYTYGWQNAGLAFLRYALGYDMISGDTVIYEKSGETLPDMDVIERPDFDFNVPGNHLKSDDVYGMGSQNSQDIYIQVGDAPRVHNALIILDPDKYGESGTIGKHPKWYSDDGTQICWLTHGDDVEYKAMVDTLAEIMINAIKANPTLANITFTQMDQRTECTCKACNDSRAIYGTTSAGMIQFLNCVDDKVQAYLDSEAEAEGVKKRDFYIVFFAYHKSENPPSRLNAKGEYEPIDDSVVCNPHVVPYMAFIDAKYDVSFYDEANKDAMERLRGWVPIADRLYVWLYSSAVNCYLYPYNSYSSLVETYRFCKANGVSLIFPQGQTKNQYATTNFNKLKEYVWSKIQFDVNLDYGTLVDRFFENYFDVAAKPMREFFDQLTMWLEYLPTKFPGTVNGDCFNWMDRAELWPKRLLDGWTELCNEAYAAIEQYRLTDPAKYARLYEHIKVESIFPRFALLDSYSGYYMPDDLLELRKEFRDDCATLGFTAYSEYKTLEEILSSRWGF